MSSSGGEVSQFWFISFNFPLLNTLHRRPLDASNALKNHQLISILYGVRVPGVEWSMPFARWVDFSFISSNLHKHSLGAFFYLLDIYLLNLSLLYFPLLTFVWLTKEYLSLLSKKLLTFTPVIFYLTQHCYLLDSDFLTFALLWLLTFAYDQGFFYNLLYTWFYLLNFYLLDWNFLMVNFTSLNLVLLALIIFYLLTLLC